MTSTVYVKNISTSTSEKEIKEFFSFCGKISKIEVTQAGETQNATVVFEKETAAKTALLLDNTQLGRTQVSVSGAEGAKEFDPTVNLDRDSDEITQEEKPRSRIIAEYLAQGYVIGDTAAQRALDLDKKHGITNKFLQTLYNLDAKYKATDKAQAADQTYGITARAQGIFNTLASYYDKATHTPTGQKLVNFYTQTEHEVMDIHKEARRLADLKKEESGTGNTCKCGADVAKCKCAPGSCDCKSCAKNGKSKKNVLGSDKTVCTCGGDDEFCSCEAGHCACAKCPRSKTKVEGTEKTRCECGGNEKACVCEQAKCACNACPKASGNVKSSCACGPKQESGTCSGNPKSCKKCGDGKTKCDCGGNEKNCACKPEECACASCPKSKTS